MLSNGDVVHASKSCTCHLALPAIFQGRNRYNINRFEDVEADRAWLHLRCILPDMMWDPSTTIRAKQVSTEESQEEDRLVSSLLWGDAGRLGSEDLNRM